jgi:elongator complex protein 6
MPNPIPPVLEPYLAPSPQSLTLITATLDATANWLVLRFIYAALNAKSPSLQGGPSADVKTDTPYGNLQVIFVSLLRGLEQWREMGRRVVRDPCLFLRPRPPPH